ncbi:MAG: hypothetical protein ABI212_12550 [Burkholderiaceae bacterium]
MSLQQEDVIPVHMGTHTTAVTRVTNHRVVEPRGRQKIKVPLHKPVHCFFMTIHPLHEQRPPRTIKRRQCAPGKRSMPEPPAVVKPGDQARFDVSALGQSEQLRTPQSNFIDALDSTPHKQGFLLPMAAHELCWRHTA